jgi:hypothetical protein
MSGFDSKRQAALDKLVELTEELRLYEDKPAQEPVAWGYRNHDGAIYDCISPEAHADAEGDYTVPLYDIPPQRPWVGLTPTNMEELSAEWWEPNENEMVLIAWVEAKLKEKNDGSR